LNSNVCFNKKEKKVYERWKKKSCLIFSLALLKKKQDWLGPVDTSLFITSSWSIVAVGPG
jgi:hypothetical protein